MKKSYHYSFKCFQGAAERQDLSANQNFKQIFFQDIVKTGSNRSRTSPCIPRIQKEYPIGRIKNNSSYFQCFQKYNKLWSNILGCLFFFNVERIDLRIQLVSSDKSSKAYDSPTQDLCTIHNLFLQIERAEYQKKSWKQICMCLIAKSWHEVKFSGA